MCAFCIRRKSSSFQLFSTLLLLRLAKTSSMSVSSSSSSTRRHLVRIAEPVWRHAAELHAHRIRTLLGPGLTLPDHVLNSGTARQQRRRRKKQDADKSDTTVLNRSSSTIPPWTALDPKHPVYNFLIEYYGLKGVKGPKRLARWSPNPALVWRKTNDEHNGDRITSLEDLMTVNVSSNDYGRSNKACDDDDGGHDGRTTTSMLRGGVLLEGATKDDVGSVLHLRGASPTHDGICYSPFDYYGAMSHSTSKNPSTPYVWYRSILQQTLTAEPVLHCHGLHEWAMQYQPEGSEAPPSAQYQSHLPLRVSRDVINAAVERRGISCTHVDALRYFAPAAGPLNHHGASLRRTDQLRLEQPACVHAHMDLLKMCLKLQPFVDCVLLQRVLDVALQARRLDVASSPYDVRAYGVDSIVPVETLEGRAQYREEQVRLMERAEPVRRDLLEAYDCFLNMAFREESASDDGVRRHNGDADEERYAKAEPGGLPWRRNLVAEKQMDTALYR